MGGTAPLGLLVRKMGVGRGGASLGAYRSLGPLSKAGGVPRGRGKGELTSSLGRMGQGDGSVLRKAPLGPGPHVQALISKHSEPGRVTEGKEHGSCLPHRSFTCSFPAPVTRMHTHVCVHNAHTCRCTHACTHVCVHTCTHVHTCMHIHAGTHMHTQAHTCAHTCTLKRALPLSSVFYHVPALFWTHEHEEDPHHRCFQPVHHDS